MIRNSSKPGQQLLSEGGGKQIVNPTGEVLTLGELVAMMERGQDVSAYERNGSWGPDDDEPNHEQVDLHHFQNLDLSEKQEFASQHAQSLNALAADIEAAQKLEREEIVQEATEKLRKEKESEKNLLSQETIDSEKPTSKKSSSKKYKDDE